MAFADGRDQRSNPTMIACNRAFERGFSSQLEDRVSTSSSRIQSQEKSWQSVLGLGRLLLFKPTTLRTIAHLVPDLLPFFAPRERTVTNRTNLGREMLLFILSGHGVYRSVDRCSFCLSFFEGWGEAKTQRSDKDNITQSGFGSPSVRRCARQSENHAGQAGWKWPMSVRTSQNTWRGFGTG